MAPLPPLAWFRAFESAARHLSFTAAAGELGLTQSAVSQNIRSLEQRFGSALFLRKPRGLALTDAGRRLLPYVSEAIGKLSDAASLFGLGDTAGADLTVAASVSFIQWYLTPNIARLADDLPGCRVRLVSTVWPDDFAASAADVQIRFGPEGLVGRNAVRLEPNRMIAVAKAGSHAKGAVLGAGERFIQTVGTSDGWADWCQAADAPTVPEPVILADSYGLATDLARAGAGIALVHELIALPALIDGSLVRVHEHAGAAKDGYFLALRGDRNVEPAQAFADWLFALLDGYRARAGQ